MYYNPLINFIGQSFSLIPDTKPYSCMLLGDRCYIGSDFVGELVFLGISGDGDYIIKDANGDISHISPQHVEFND